MLLKRDTQQLQNPPINSGNSAPSFLRHLFYRAFEFPHYCIEDRAQLPL